MQRIIIVLGLCLNYTDALLNENWKEIWREKPGLSIHNQVQKVKNVLVPACENYTLWPMKRQSGTMQNTQNRVKKPVRTNKH